MDYAKLIYSTRVYDDSFRYLHLNSIDDNCRQKGIGWEFLPVGAKCIDKPDDQLDGYYIYLPSFDGKYVLDAKIIILDVEELKSGIAYENVPSFLYNEPIGPEEYGFHRLELQDMLAWIGQDFPKIVNKNWNVVLGGRKKPRQAKKICFLTSIDVDVLHGSFLDVLEKYCAEKGDALVDADEIRGIIVSAFVKRLAQIYDVVCIPGWFQDDTSVFGLSDDYKDTNSMITVNDIFLNSDVVGYHAVITDEKCRYLVIWDDNTRVKQPKSSINELEAPYSFDEDNENDESDLSNSIELTRKKYLVFGNVDGNVCRIIFYSHHSHVALSFSGDAMYFRTEDHGEAFSVGISYYRMIKKINKERRIKTRYPK